MGLPYLTVEYESGSLLQIEGFGPATIAGAVKDILNGDYKGPDGRNDNPVKSIKITKESSF